MITAFAGIFSILSSGAGGGLLGGVFGLFKQSQERKERVEMAEINLERDNMEYANAKDERAHSLVMLERTAELKLEGIQVSGQLELEKIQTETEAEVELSHQATLSSAQDVLKGLKTSSAMDNYRASVRPTLAYGFAIIFCAMLGWAFVEFSDQIDPATGRELLVGLFGTLTFLVTSIGTFYYVARRNSAPRV